MKKKKMKESLLDLWWRDAHHTERRSPGQHTKIYLSFSFNVSVLCQQIPQLQDSMKLNKDYIKLVCRWLSWKAPCADKRLV